MSTWTVVGRSASTFTVMAALRGGGPDRFTESMWAGMRSTPGPVKTTEAIERAASSTAAQLRSSSAVATAVRTPSPRRSSSIRHG